MNERDFRKHYTVLLDELAERPEKQGGSDVRANTTRAEPGPTPSPSIPNSTGEVLRVWIEDESVPQFLHIHVTDPEGYAVARGGTVPAEKLPERA